MENWGEFANSSSSCFPYTHLVAGPMTAPAGGVGHHITCLKLGSKRGEGAGGAVNKRERLMGGVAPTCQVDGCGKVLIGAKDYHRRHKVCEMHSKAPRVVVMGSEQRFCQQCSRFHAISEFDESKRSCRRRLAGHNERRRKNSSTNDPVMRNPMAPPRLEMTMVSNGFPFLSQMSSGSARSLLSSRVSPWIPTLQHSSHSGAALRELISENRASLLAQHLFSNRGSGPIFSVVPYQNQDVNTQDWNQFNDFGGQLTLDLLHSSNSTDFEFLSGTIKSKEDEEGCCQMWKSLEEGTCVV